MARSVADCAFFLRAIAGPEERAPLSIHEDPAQFARPLERSFKGVRVAWFRDLGGVPFDKRTRAVIEAQRKRFIELGCIVEEAEPDFGGADEAFRTMRALNFYRQHHLKVAEHRARIKATVLEEVDLGAKLTGPQIARADQLQSALYQRVGEFFGKYEYFVLPATQVPAFDIHQQYVTEIDGRKLGNYIDWMRACYYISVLHNPAISVPAGFTTDGLPVGLQIVGRHQADWSVLQLAHAFEQSAQVYRVPELAS
jgi:amidase